MSIYSGFATRQQEQTYDHILDSLLYVLQRRITKFYLNQASDEGKFTKIVMKLHSQLRILQKNKYLEPKSSLALKQLIECITTHCDAIVSGTVLQQEASIQYQNPEPEPEPITYWVEKQPKPNVKQQVKHYNKLTQSKPVQNKTHERNMQEKERKTSFRQVRAKSRNTVNAINAIHNTQTSHLNQQGLNRSIINGISYINGVNNNEMNDGVNTNGLNNSVLNRNVINNKGISSNRLNESRKNSINNGLNSNRMSNNGIMSRIQKKNNEMLRGASEYVAMRQNVTQFPTSNSEERQAGHIVHNSPKTNEAKLQREEKLNEGRGNQLLSTSREGKIAGIIKDYIVKTRKQISSNRNTRKKSTISQCSDHNYQIN